MSDSIFEKRMAVPFKLNLPDNLSEYEETTVINVLNKWRHNRFHIQSGQNTNSMIRPYSIVDLLRIDNRCSLTHYCGNIIEKRWRIDDIAEKISVNVKMWRCGSLTTKTYQKDLFAVF